MSRFDIAYTVFKAAAVSWLLWHGFHVWIDGQRAHALFDFAIAGYFTWSTFYLLRKSKQLRGE